MAAGIFTHNSTYNSYENPKNAEKRSFKNFKLSIHKVVSTRKNFAKNVASCEPIGCVRFAKILVNKSR